MTWNTSMPDMSNQVSADIPDIAENFATLDYDYLWVPAEEMITLTTNGAAAGTNEYATNDVMLSYFAFDDGTEEYVAFTKVLSERWNKGTIKAKFYWSSASGSSIADTVEWQLQALALSHGDTIDGAYTDTGEVISDAVTAANGTDLQITDATPAITINGPPALGDMINFKVSRNVAGTDDMTEDAWLFGVFLQLSPSEAVTAW